MMNDCPTKGTMIDCKSCTLQCHIRKLLTEKEVLINKII